VAYPLTVAGLLGIFLSLTIAQSDYDPIALGIASVSILMAIIGISLVLKEPSNPPRRSDKES
jgi:hypothetical protein